jgi:hypothetical protein
MTVPTATKTYQFSTSISGSGSDDNADLGLLLYNIKSALVGWTNSPWTVSGSSDKTTAGMDSVDRWTDSSKVLWADKSLGAHSWIVLKQTGISSTFELLIDLWDYNFNPRRVFISVDPAGFTDGSITARPTGSSESVLWNNDFFVLTDTVMGSIVMGSTDGTVTRIFTVGANGIVPQYMSFEVPKNPVTGWTNPWIATAYSTNSTTVHAVTSTAFSNTARYKGRVGTTDFSAYLGGEGFNGTLINSLRRQDYDSQKYIGTNISIISETAGAVGRLGELQDCWWWPTVNLDTSSIILWPSGTRTHIQLGDILFPWSGSLPNVFPR